MEPQPEPPATPRRLGSRLAIAVMFCGCAALITTLLAGLAVGVTVRYQEKSAMHIHMGRMREIAEGFAEYRRTMGTDTAPYPSDIHQLEALGITPNIRMLLSARHEGDWLYFWAADPENPSAPLLISPPLAGPEYSFVFPLKHVVLNVNGEVHLVEAGAVAEAVRSSPEPPYKVPATLKK